MTTPTRRPAARQRRRRAPARRRDPQAHVHCSCRTPTRGCRRWPSRSPPAQRDDLRQGAEPHRLDRRAHPLLHRHPPLAPGQDTVDEFLFGNRTGFCEQISTVAGRDAALRSASRHAKRSGTCPGPTTPSPTSTTSQAKDAHAWVQVWFPGYGWQSFDPTAVVPLANPSPGSTLAARRAPARCAPAVDPHRRRPRRRRSSSHAVVRRRRRARHVGRSWRRGASSGPGRRAGRPRRPDETLSSSTPPPSTTWPATARGRGRRWPWWWRPAPTEATTVGPTTTARPTPASASARGAAMALGRQSRPARSPLAPPTRRRRGRGWRCGSVASARQGQRLVEARPRLEQRAVPHQLAGTAEAQGGGEPARRARRGRRSGPRRRTRRPRRRRRRDRGWPITWILMSYWSDQKYGTGEYGVGVGPRPPAGCGPPPRPARRRWSSARCGCGHPGARRTSGPRRRPPPRRRRRAAWRRPPRRWRARGPSRPTSPWSGTTPMPDHHDIGVDHACRRRARRRSTAPLRGRHPGAQRRRHPPRCAARRRGRRAARRTPRPSRLRARAPAAGQGPRPR